MSLVNLKKSEDEFFEFEHGDDKPNPNNAILQNANSLTAKVEAGTGTGESIKKCTHEACCLHDGDNNRQKRQDAAASFSLSSSVDSGSSPVPVPVDPSDIYNGLFWETTLEISGKTVIISMRGIIFVFLWYSSIFWSVIFIYCPLIPLLFINRAWFRKLTDIIMSCWEMYPAVLLELMIGCRVYISGDTIRPEDGAILLMNHRNRLDWFFLWAALLHGTKPPAHRAKFVLKSDVRNIPGIGWGLQLAGFLYIHRNWEKDQALLARSLNYFKDLGNKYQILIFAEGTDLSPESKAKSNAFAQKNGMKAYDYVLHPRTTGFTFLAHQMEQNKQLDAVYDMTIAYPKTLPETEMDIIQGKFPQEVHFHIKRYGRSSLPKTEVGLKTWCEERWGEKEVALRDFYGKTGGRRKEFCSEALCETPWNAMYLAFVFWTLFTLTAKYLFFTSNLAFYYVISCTLFFIILSRYTDGIQQFEISLHHYFNKSSLKTDQMGSRSHDSRSRSQSQSESSPTHENENGKTPTNKLSNMGSNKIVDIINGGDNIHVDDVTKNDLLDLDKKYYKHNNSVNNHKNHHYQNSTVRVEDRNREKTE